jgi:hypothetical protein
MVSIPAEDATDADNKAAKQEEHQRINEHIGSNFDEEDKSCLHYAGASGGPVCRPQEGQGPVRRLSKQGRDLEQESVSESDDCADERYEKNGM